MLHSVHRRMHPLLPKSYTQKVQDLWALAYHRGAVKKDFKSIENTIGFEIFYFLICPKSSKHLFGMLCLFDCRIAFEVSLAFCIIALPLFPA